MKKIIIGVLAFLAIILAVGFGGKYAMDKYWETNYGGPSYYTKITGDAVNTGVESGSTYYEYDQVSYDENGVEETVHLKEYRDSPLRIGAYLKMVVNDEKGVTSWEEVQESDLPSAVADKLVE
ncbi:YxeA family protein [Enterococcus sp. LJL120]